MAAPQGYTKKETRKAREKVSASDMVATAILDGSTPELTVEICQFGVVAEKVTFQANSTLAGTIEFTANGTDWYGSTAIAGSNAPVSYSTHLAKAARVTRSAGSGQLFILVK